MWCWALFSMEARMRADLLERLLKIMRGENDQNTVGTVGTLERGGVPTSAFHPVQPKFQQAHLKCANNFNGVPTVPTVPTPNIKVREDATQSVVHLLEPALEREMPAAAIISKSTRHICVCGAVGIIGMGWSLNAPEKTVWRCGPCDRAERGVRLF